ncbi:hypothetical protein DY78_GL002986 [Lactiplantibacillus fabifermentans DSM 21115]|uniref:Uncharacterized protein n=1 Tax=Lactiplantibacillus fabifermentans DSM 21115 TaxID=1413187 RepID=A0A0R2NPS8_9LACO|nr:hypothetical protein DY78_GL002986 [Lactiplantibacillus fabifermentans DSM 21115]
MAVKSYITDSISTLTLVLGILWPGHNTLAMSFLAILCILLNLASTWSILMVDSFNSLLDTAAAKKTLCAVIGINFIAVLIVTKSFIQIFTAAT